MVKDYTAIARQRITTPTRSKRMPRILVYGRNKKGKTRFSATAPDVLFLDPEDGTREESRIDPDVWPITQWSDMEDVAGFLRSRHNKSPITGNPYRWVSWDGCTRIATIALNYIRKVEMERDLTRRPTAVTTPDYGKANELIKEAIHRFHSIHDIGIIFTVQERMIEISQMEDFGDDEDMEPAGYMYVPDLPKGARAAFNQVVDVIGRLYVVRGDFTRTKRVRRDGKVIEKEVPANKERRLWIGPHEMYDTGYRSGYELPDFVRQPTVDKLVTALREGKVG